MSERRLDPRTDARFSLRNLLRIRSARGQMAMVVLSTADGVLMAGTQEDRAAQRAAAHAADELARGATDFAVDGRAAWQMRGLRFDVDGSALCLAALGEGSVARAALEEIAERVRAILREGKRITGSLRRSA